MRVTRRVDEGVAMGGILCVCGGREGRQVKTSEVRKVRRRGADLRHLERKEGEKERIVERGEEIK